MSRAPSERKQMMYYQVPWPPAPRVV